MSGIDEERILSKAPILGKPSQSMLQPPEARAPFRTGNAYADQGMLCDTSSSAGCFLQPAQRARIVQMFQGRVGAALLSYRTACTELRIDELLEKEPGMGLLFEAILEVVGLVCVSAIGKMFKALQATAERIVADAGLIVDLQGLPARETSVWAQRLAAIDRSSLNSVSKSLVTLMKKHVPRADSPPKVGVAFLDQLTMQAGPMFEAIREQAPAMVADDSALLVLFDSFAAVHQTVQEYKEQITGKLDRFKQTQIGDIGTHATSATLPEDNARAHMPSGYLTDGFDFEWPGRRGNRITVGPRDVKLFLVDTLGKRQLALYRREFIGANNQNHIAAPIAIPPIKRNLDEMTDDDFTFVAMVPDEFAEVALRSHLASWGTMPSEKVFTPWAQ